MLFEWVTVKGQFSCSSFSVPAMVKTEETPWCLVSRMSSTQMTLSPAFLSPRRCPPVKISLWPVTRRRQYQQPPPSHRTQTWTVNLTWKREWLNPSKLQRAVSIPKMHLVEIKLEYVAYSEIGSVSVLDCQDTGYNAWRQGHIPSENGEHHFATVSALNHMFPKRCIAVCNRNMPSQSP